MSLPGFTASYTERIALIAFNDISFKNQPNISETVSRFIDEPFFIDLNNVNSDMTTCFENLKHKYLHKAKSEYLGKTNDLNKNRYRREYYSA